MSETDFANLNSPYWIEDCDYLDGTQSGTYVIEGEPVASYAKHPYKHLVANLFTIDEQDCPKVLIEIEGRRGPFRTIEQAKQSLEMVARPAITDQTELN